MKSGLLLLAFHCCGGFLNAADKLVASGFSFRAKYVFGGNSGAV
jgi:hypothetical protein